MKSIEMTGKTVEDAVSAGVKALGCDPSDFKFIVKTAFGQRRKTLRNSLKPLIASKASREGWDAERLAAFVSDPVFDLRPERLGVEEFVSLTNMFASRQ